MSAEGARDPLVTVITPAHNAARFIVETIRSVQEQSFTDWEQIVIDDVSRDGTAELVARVAADDPRVRLLRLETNAGPAGARNAGLAQARGRYVAFLDSDDLWLPLKLEKQIDFMRARNLAFSFASYSLIDEEGRPLEKTVRAPQRIDYRGLLRNTIIGCLTVVLDRSQLGPLSMPPLPQHEDLSLWFRILKGGVVAEGLPEVLARYRVVRGSASRDKLRSARHMWKVYREQEQLSLPVAAWCYAQYAWHAYWKNRR